MENNQENKFLKILLISDDHILISGVNLMTYNIIKQRDPDLILHCGDMEDEETYKKLKQFYKDDFIYVKGNCDYWCDKYPEIKREELFEIELGKNRYSIFMFHGDGYFISKNGSPLVDAKHNAILGLIKEKCKSLNKPKLENPDFVIGGHIHKQLCSNYRKTTYINCGSLNQNYSNDGAKGNFAILYLSFDSKIKSHLETYSIMQNGEIALKNNYVDMFKIPRIKSFNFQHKDK